MWPTFINCTIDAPAACVTILPIVDHKQQFHKAPQRYERALTMFVVR
jgi:hypothetical protein